MSARQHVPVAVAAALLVAALGSLGSVRDARAAEPDVLERAVDDPVVEEPSPEMLRYPPSSVRAPLIVGGLGIVVAAYVPGMISGFVWGDVPGADALKIPVVGPWIALGQSGCSPDETECDGVLAMRAILFSLSGLVQIGGLALAAEGMFSTTEAEASASPAASTGPPPALAIELAPIVTPTMAGVGVSGRF